MRQIVLDTETTGLETKEGHRMIEIAGVELVNRRLTGRVYHQYLCPQRDIDAEAVAIHGITTAFLADKPLFADIVAELMDFLGSAELIIHNAPFDVSFINMELGLLGATYKPITAYCAIFDTLALARKKHPGKHNNLDALCKRYTIDNSERALHGALLDAHLLAKVYLAMTGGQTTLFDEEAVIETQKMAEVTHLSKEARQTPVFLDLPVIYANEVEQAAHEQRLAKVKKANGGTCLWGG